ncbi:MAG: C4-dicarboxylic acid transporter DauA [Planctomycetota bacterium]|nr:C4-dicarboxylic acid transporter DauA [Planctomycetota bacterium]
MNTPPASVSKTRRISRRLDPSQNLFALGSLRPAGALRRCLRDGYGGAQFRADLLAGIVVGMVALPLSMALAIASGVAPQHGLYTAIVAGGVTALLGGSRVQVTGPTAAFVVLLAPVSAQYGFGGLALASLMAGVILVGMGFFRMGRLIEFIPHPVTTGFTAGIAVVIATLQLKDFLGLTVAHMPETYLERVAALFEALPTARAVDLGVGALTLALLILWPKLTRKVPAPLVALTAASLAAYALAQAYPEQLATTINARFSYLLNGEVRQGIPQLPPAPLLPWHLDGPQGQPLELSFGLLRALLGPAFAIAMLGAIESLLSAVVADGMTGYKHDPDTELLAQGAGNLLAPFFGGFAATGAIARTATNIRAGARSPLAAAVHALFVLGAVVLFAPLLGYLPMAALAALLILVAWNMSDLKHFIHTLKVAPKSDVAVLLACFGLTVIFDMVVAVSAGVVLAALLFMRRMAEVTGARLLSEEHHERADLPPGVMLYEIGGPLFFGAAQKAMSAIHAVSERTRVVVLDLRSVPAMDATGLVNLESALGRLRKNGVFVVLAGVQAQPGEVLAKAGVADEDGILAVRHGFEEGLEVARCAAEAGSPAPR